MKPEHIRDLSDVDLRELLGRLCEAEMVHAGHSTAAVTYGGDQNAADGGIDVRVEADASGVQGYVPRDRTGFQAKAEDFPPSAIKGEMRPRGVLRPAIEALAAAGGAYIIASSKGSTADAARTRRLNAMRKALAGCSDAHRLHIDFYDRQRLVSWVNRHPGVAVWVRRQVGQAVPGWRGFEDWSATPSPIDAPFLLDDGLRLLGPSAGGGLDMLTGIARLRSELATPGGSVRLTGLSGVGKTRLAAALFDPVIGAGALHPSLAVYADLGDEPDPVPLHMLEHVIRERHRCVLIVDNCSPTLHNRLVRGLGSGSAGVSLLTIEYDISDDEPEQSAVFSLEPVSEDMIQRIVARHHPSLEKPELAAIAHFSHGNSRVALALASTARHGTSLANLRDGELFRRLFHQGKKESPDLLRTAEILSLVYSFQGEDLAEAGEMSRLAQLAGQSVGTVYAQVAELRARKLVQRRGPWRALLPHALAHRLAGEALRKVPSEDIQTQLADPKSPRLLRSFTRRLREFHDLSEAQAIVSGWLADDGRLGQVEHLGKECLVILDNVAPVDPDGVLTAIERAAARDFAALSAADWRMGALVGLLHSIAYEAEFFDRAVILIAQFTAALTKLNKKGDPADVFASLFRAALSGTLATPVQRATLVREIAAGKRGVDPDLAMVALRAMLESDYFTSSSSFEFGMRRRGFGWEIDSHETLREWFMTALNLCQDLSVGGEFQPAVRQVLVGQIRHLAALPQLDEDIARVVRDIAADDGWPEAWARVLVAGREAAQAGRSDVAERLSALARDLAPRSVGDRIAVYVLPEDIHAMNAAEAEHPDADDFHGIVIRHQFACNEVGRELAEDPAERSRWLPILLRKGGGGVGLAGEGLGRWTKDPEATWREMRGVMTTLQADERRTSFLGGFVKGVAGREPFHAETILDDIAADRELQFAFVATQVQVGLTGSATARLATAAALPGVPVLSFDLLQYGGATDDLAGSETQDILVALMRREGGLRIALDVLGMRLYGHRQRGTQVAKEDRATGRMLLTAAVVARLSTVNARTAAEIVRACLVTGQDETMARHISVGLCRALRNGTARSSDLEDIVRALGSLFPRQVLDAFVGDGPVLAKGPRVRLRGLRFQDGPLSTIPPAEAVQWALSGSTNRFERLAQAIQPWRPCNATGHATEEDAALTWTETALGLIKAAPMPLPMLEIFGRRMRPSSWGGSLSNNLRRREPLLRALLGQFNSAVDGWAAAELPRLEVEIERARLWEAAQSRDRDESFAW